MESPNASPSPKIADLGTVRSRALTVPNVSCFVQETTAVVLGALVKLGMTAVLYGFHNRELKKEKEKFMKPNKKAFTLIELLVVVLIIGILAAVALPQYKKAVVKSRVGTILPMLANILKAQEAYYLSNGEYATDARTLDITPEACTLLPPSEASGLEGHFWGCGNDFVVNTSANNTGSVAASYCPGYNTTYEACSEHRDFIIEFGSAHSTSQFAYPGTRACWQSNGSSFGKEFCRSIGNPYSCGGTGSKCYELY